MDSKINDLARYRLGEAKQCLKSAKILMAERDYKGAANRSYYAIFHTMRSVLALDQIDFSKHSGVSAYFRKEYIKTKIFSVDISDIIKSAFDMRNDSDYDDYYVVSRAEVDEQIKNAERFISETEQYLKHRLQDI